MTGTNASKALDAVHELNASDVERSILTIPAVMRVIDAIPVGTITASSHNDEIVAHLLALAGSTHLDGSQVVPGDFVTTQRAYIAATYRAAR